MDPELFRLLMEILRNQNTTGSASIGGDVPYDDYSVFSSIGGLGQYPEMAGLGPDSFIPGITDAPANVNTGPSQIGFYGPQARIEERRPLYDLLTQMQAGVGAGPAHPTTAGLFGAGPVIERPKPKTAPTPNPVAAPVAAPVEPKRSGTPTPDPRRDPSTLPRKTDPPENKKVRSGGFATAQQVAQTIQRAAMQQAAPVRQYSPPPQYVAQVPVRQFSPAPTFRNPLARNVASSTSRHSK